MRAAAMLTAILMFCTTGWALADVTVTLYNQSSFGIHQLYFSPATETEWGPDQLGEEVVKPGERFELQSVPPDTYDILLVDEDGDECIIEDVKIATTENWIIEDGMLLKCQGFGSQ